jgi:hypothetical protein
MIFLLFYSFGVCTNLTFLLSIQQNKLVFYKKTFSERDICTNYNPVGFTQTEAEEVFYRLKIYVRGKSARRR